MMDKIDIAISQQQAAEGRNRTGLSNIPFYIQELDRKLDRIEYKLNLVLKKMHENDTR